MSLAAGRSLSHYRLVEQIGEGGMGVVWRATDTTLGRDVAIKVVPEAFTRDAEHMARFEREAKILASLNHPHIAAIYGLASADGVRFLAMELVDGDDLAARLAHGPLPVVEALEIARQIAEALEAAHEKGVIHRDLKPANVKVTRDGQVKVLDFGLAKALEGEAPAPTSSEISRSPTITGLLTGTNVILGTAAYMSPEQARAKPVDRRADIWAFGCVLYECLTGRRAFTGETVSDTLAKILERDPDLAALPAGVPPRVRELLSRCLAKDPRQRLRDIGDARILLDEVLAARSSSGRLVAVEAPGVGAATGRRSLAVVGIAGVIGLAAGALLWSAFGPRGAGGAGPRCLAIAMPQNVTVQSAAMTLDGRTVLALGRPKNPEGAEVAPWRLYARALGGYEFKELPGTEGAFGYLPTVDGREALFIAPVAPGSPQARFQRVPLDGSAPAAAIVDWKDAWGSVIEVDGGDLLVQEGLASFVRIPKAGGSPSPPIKIDCGRPGVSRYEFSARGPSIGRGAFVNIISYDARGWHYSVGVMDVGTGKVKVVEEDGGNAVYSPTTGHMLFARGGTVLAVRFDPVRHETRGASIAVWSGMNTAYSFIPGAFRLTRNGDLFYRPGELGGLRQTFLIDPAGKLEPWSSERLAIDDVPEVSDDGRRVALVIANGRGIDEILVSELSHPGLQRIGTDPNADCAGPVWAPDNRRIAYRRTGRDDRDGVYIQDVDGGAPQRVSRPESDAVRYFPNSWTPDGAALLMGRGESGKARMARLALAGEGSDSSRVSTLLPSAFNQFNPKVSPDGRLLAFGSDESGKNMSYVVEWRPDGSTGRRLRVETAGGGLHRWSAEGKALLVQDQRNHLMKVAITEIPALSVSAPVEVYDLDKLGISQWCVLPDGRLFATGKSEDEGEITRYNLVLDWTRELKRRLEAAR